MKLKLQHALVAVAALGAVQMASAATVVTAGVTPTLVPDGTITISGSVADSTCLVNGSNAYNNTTVPLTAALTTVLVKTREIIYAFSKQSRSILLPLFE